MTKKQIVNSVVAVSLSLVFIGIILASIFLGLFFGGVKPTVETARFVAYITQGSFSTAEDLDNMELDKYTHLIFAFADISENGPYPTFYDETSEGRVEKDDSAELRLLSSYLDANYPSVTLAVGFAHGAFCETSKDEAKRKLFAEGCKEWMEEYNLDGFDVDWEYPDVGGCSTCCRDHALLLAQMRETLGEDAVLSAAIAAWPAMISHLDVSSLNKSLSFVNVMTYDYAMDNHTPYDKTRNSMYYAHLAGFDKEKLNVGLPYYGRSVESDYWGYDGIADAIDSGELTLVETDNESYAYNSEMRHSFDTPKMIYKKAKLVRMCGYGGVFCWHLSCDRDYELINAAYKAIADEPWE